ncbi:MAG TPA: hypothetical protein VF875_13325 [Anaeromyxobacter sp.]
MIRRFLSSLLAVAVVVAAAPASAQVCASWSLAAEYAASPAKNPIVDACGQAVWALQYAPTRARDPNTYLPLDSYLPFHGSQGWQLTSPVFYWDGYAHLPAIALNSTGATLQIPVWAPFPWDPGVVLAHPGPDQPTVVVFRSPVTATLSISATFTSLDFNGGDGVDVTVDTSTGNLWAGYARYGSPAALPATQVVVRAGDPIYFTVGPYGQLYYDSTRLDITVAVVERGATVDIRPWETPNVVNLRSNGLVDVAILTTAALDATTIDVSSVKLAGAPVATRGDHLHAVLEDVNGDGRLDLLVRFEVAALKLEPNATTATVVGTAGGVGFRGSDSIVVVQ